MLNIEKIVLSKHERVFICKGRKKYLNLQAGKKRARKFPNMRLMTFNPIRTVLALLIAGCVAI